MNRSSLHQQRTVLIDTLAEHEARGTMGRYGKGRGIVFTAGNADTLMRVVYTLRMLRNGEHLNSGLLPVPVHDASSPTGLLGCLAKPVWFADPLATSRSSIKSTTPIFLHK